MLRHTLLLVLLPTAALAQGDGLPGENNTERLIGLVLTLLVPFLVKLFRDWQKDNADRRMAIIRDAAKLTFWLTEEAKKLWPDKVPNALLYAQGKFMELLDAQGIKPTEAELAIAKATWGASHGVEKVQEELVKAGALVATAVPPVPSRPLPQHP